MKRFKVDFANGAAIEEIKTPKGNTLIKRFKLFVDQKGIHIINRKGVEYLTPENCEVM